MDGSGILLAAHRGDRFQYPENTMPAFQSAIDFGADMIETDIRMTKDGELILIHDRSMLRTTGIDQNVDELTLSEIKELKIPAPIPTVREFLKLAAPCGILVNWELKVYPSDFNDDTAFLVADKLVELIEEYHMEDKSMINSFSNRVLEYVNETYKGRFPIHGQGIYHCRRAKDTCTSNDVDLYDWCCLYPNTPGAKALDFKENFEFCLQNNILPCLCIPDDLEDYQKAIDYGCKMFTSNNIYEAAHILSALGVR